MDRIKNIFENRPNFLGQAQCHRRCQVQQRVMHSCPVVQIPPQPQGILQHFRQARTIASTSSQAGLLTSYRSVEPFQMGCIDLLADAQFANAMFDGLLRTKQGFGRDSQQIASFVPELLDYTDLQIRRGLEPRMFFSAPPSPTSTMLDLAKNLQNCRWIRQVIVDQQQGQTCYCRIHPHRGYQLARHRRGAWTNPQIDQKSAGYRQRRMNPRAPFFLTRRLRCGLSDRIVFVFLGLLTTRPCSSSNWTASNGSSSRSNCKRWKSSARLPAFSNKRCTVRVSTSQISAVASIEQPCPRHLVIRTTSASGNLVYCISEPWRSLKRVPQVLQYSRRIVLSLPIHSATDRLPALKRLKSAQSPFGQVKNDKGGLVGLLTSLAFCRLGIRALLAKYSHLSDKISAKRPQYAQFCRYSLPISRVRTLKRELYKTFREFCLLSKQ